MVASDHNPVTTASVARESPRTGENIYRFQLVTHFLSASAMAVVLVALGRTIRLPWGRLIAFVLACSAFGAVLVVDRIRRNNVVSTREPPTRTGTGVGTGTGTATGAQNSD